MNRMNRMKCFGMRPERPPSCSSCSSCQNAVGVGVAEAGDDARCVLDASHTHSSGALMTRRSLHLIALAVVAISSPARAQSAVQPTAAPRLATADSARTLPRGTPEQQGISSAAILRFVEAADTGVDAMHGVVIVR